MGACENGGRILVKFVVIQGMEGGGKGGGFGVAQRVGEGGRCNI